MFKLGKLAIDVAKHYGADYADIRIIDTKNEEIVVKNGKLNVDYSNTLGFGIRVLYKGSWGFSSSDNLTTSEIKRVAKEACFIAKASSSLQREKVRLAKEDTYKDHWFTPVLKNPFRIPLERKADLLFKIDEILRKKSEIKVAYSEMSFQNIRKWFINSEGSEILQDLLRSGAGYSATALGNDDMQVRSYPASFGGQYYSGGYEIIEQMELLQNAERIRDEAIALLTAPQCPDDVKDIIIGGAQMVLQIHESVGHATELDRVLGYEENYAGSSFATLEKYKKFRYGSKIVNLFADATIPMGLATQGYDDDGVKSQRWDIVKDGILVGYMTNRELAHKIGDTRSKGCNRSQGFYSIPIIRISNLSLAPGEWELEDLIKDTKDGIYMDVNKSWSIDQRRLNFQFGCEIGYEIKDGKLGRMLKNCSYQDITPVFWNKCDAICNENYWDLWGVINCGKGQPGQRAEMSHGAAPTRFRKVKVGIGNK
uniref:TldD/PmbA family protein n=1 Tax=candidate division WOR-3 bacterium TaxID=2052148 RepID=A0A7C3J6W8_UNCW3